MAVGVPALLYHKVTPVWEVGITWVTPRRFAAQMRRLSETGWKTILPDELAQSPDAGSADGGRLERRFILAFDDGYECVWRHALPILAELGFQATVFIPTGFVDGWNEWDHQLLGRKFRHINPHMLSDIVSAGWEVGSHGVSHRPLTGLDEAALRNELTNSKARLEELTGASVHWCAFPFGRYDERVLDAAIQAGYLGALTPMLRRGNVPVGFHVWTADSVYLWDTPASVLRLLTRDAGYEWNIAIRHQAHRLCSGTIMWQKFFASRAAASLD